MFPITEIPVGRGLGLVLLVLAGLFAWWNPTLVESDDPAGTHVEGRQLSLACALVGALLLIVGQVAVFPWPTYGLMMGIGTVSITFMAMRWCSRRGISNEVVLEYALLGFAAGLIGGRLVHVAENWDSRFAAQPATILLGADAPLPEGADLTLRTAQGQARVTLTGDDPQAWAEALRPELARIGVALEVVRALHRGNAGVVEHLRGLKLTTVARGEDARLELVGGQALRPLGLQPGVASGAPQLPWAAILFDLSIGGLTFFGAVLGILVVWTAWTIHRKLPMWTVLDAGAPIFPWGTFWGRIGCFAKGCCWGREADGLLPGVHYPPWSLPWYQLAGEQASCQWDGALADGQMTSGLREALGPLADGTPALIPTQLIEGVGALLIFGLILLYQWKWQRRGGQSFALLIVLQCPLRWLTEHLRRDHDYFFDLIPSYPLTVTQVTSGLFLLFGIGLMVWVSRRGPLLVEGAARGGADSSSR